MRTVGEHRYVVIGAGAIGGAIGTRLHQSGRAAVLVARGPHLQALREHGMRLRAPGEDVRVPVSVVGSPVEVTLSEQDVLVFATKAHQVTDALRTWADVEVRAGDRVVGTAGSLLPVLTALNGVAAESMALRYFRRVYGVCVWMPAVHLVPGEVIIRGAPRSGMLHLGAVPPQRRSEDPEGSENPEGYEGSDSDAEVLRRVSADLTRAGFDVPLPPDVMPWKYRKLISNLGNVVQALVGPEPGNQWADLTNALEQEARHVLDLAEIEVTPDGQERAARRAGFTMRSVAGVPDDVGGSTWQSLRRGTGNVETDYLNGEIVKIAHRAGAQAPLNARLASLARRAAQAGAGPGSLTRAQLAAHLDDAGVVLPASP